jgi:hypothetical protein
MDCDINGVRWSANKKYPVRCKSCDGKVFHQVKCGTCKGKMFIPSDAACHLCKKGLKKH